MTKKIAGRTLVVLTILLLLYTLMFPHKTAVFCRSALGMCGKTLIPSTFMFLVLSRLISHFSDIGMFSGRFISFLSKIFALPEILIPSVILGFFSSAPSGAFAIGRIYSDKQCTKKQAEKACIISNNCSAAFIFSIVSAMCGKLLFAAIIFISNILSNLFVYFIFFRDKNDSERKSSIQNVSRKELSFSSILSESITASSTVTLKICGCVIFFSCLGNLTFDFASNLFPGIFYGDYAGYIKSLFLSFFEMTSGIIALEECTGYEKILLTGSAVSFCGLSIIMQTLGIMENLGLSPSSYIVSRFLCAITTPLIILAFLFLLPESMSVSLTFAAKNTCGFAFGDLFSLTAVTVIFISAGAIMSYLDK